MEIERVSENQIKFILNKNDLRKRNLRIGELSYDSDKIQELFNEMMEQAMLEHDFNSEHTPLMIEATPISSDSIVIIVTKVNGPNDLEDRFNAFSAKKDISKLKRKLKLDSRPLNSSDSNNFIIYSFDNLELASELSKRVIDNYVKIKSGLYKYNNRYYLALEIFDFENDFRLPLESILSEYGQKHISTSMSPHFLNEHGEALIKQDAIYILSRYLG
ncbi:MAG: adaptor protein MecA [Clostridiales bacterium]|jgi:adapter protein MecA 1/2|nr:adaptor protein MecA [Clostridiales bacterium]